MKRSHLIPIAIVIAASIIALAIYTIERAKHPPVAAVPVSTLMKMRPVDATDHILGNPAAPIVFVEYADIDCPFCKAFHDTMEEIMSTYGASGNVAWVFRHFPIIELHPYAEQHAEAAECVSALGGSDEFWKFIDALHAAAPGANQFDPAGYDAVVTTLGIPLDQFHSCLSSGRFKDRVAADYGNALDAGGTGTPYTILLVKGEPPTALTGAYPYDSVASLIDAALAQVKSTGAAP